MMTNRREDPAKQISFKQRALVVLGFVGLLWAVEVLDFVIFRGGLDRFGIRPRVMSGLWGIPFAPLLHGGFRHLIANTFPLLVLGTLLALYSANTAMLAILFIVGIGGAGVWFFGAGQSVHVGASGLVFGLAGFLVIMGLLRRKLVGILIALGVGLFYGGLIWGILPGQKGISWESHLFGCASGVLAAFVLAKKENEREKARLSS